MGGGQKKKKFYFVGGIKKASGGVFGEGLKSFQRGVQGGARKLGKE